MFVIGIFVALALMALAAFGVALAVKFGVQWAILGNLPLIKNYIKGENTENEEIHHKEKKRLEGFNLQNILSSPLVRLIFIAIICLASIIPLAILEDVSKDRSRYANYAVERVASSWGSEQAFRGAAVWIPYKERTIVADIKKDKDGNETQTEKEVWVEKNLMILPSELNIDTHIQTETRMSGIYPVPVYTANIKVSGYWPAMIEVQDSDDKKYEAERAIVAVGITDMKGLKKVSELNMGEAKIEAMSGLREGAGKGKGFHYMLPDILTQCGQKLCAFSFDMELNGVSGLNFSTTGKETYLHIKSNWAHPKFYGSGLPDEKQISDDGFEASWNVGNLVRSYPQIGANHIGMKQFDEYILGVELIQPVNPYSMVLRSVKYGLLVIGLTLIGMFIFEQAIKKELHIVQYLVTTGALSLFYLTLLSLSEHMGFLWAWIGASLIIIVMVCSYVGSALRAIKPAIGLAIFMGGVYMVMYALLRLEDYALLVGTAILLMAMIVVMRVTRKLNQRKN